MSAVQQTCARRIGEPALVQKNYIYMYIYKKRPKNDIFPSARSIIDLSDESSVSLSSHQRATAGRFLSPRPSTRR